MGSEKEGTGYQQPESPKLCANNCGFFGTAATMNLCSKCYRDLRLIEEQEASAKSAVRKSLHSQEQQQQQQQVICASVDDSALPSSSSSSRLDSANSSAVAVESGGVVVVKNRCFSCNKRVGLTGFKCRCGNTFCGTHRYAEKHDCGFDYKNAAREAIARDNPDLKPDKLERI